jgi:hypothetical protein
MSVHKISPPLARVFCLVMFVSLAGCVTRVEKKSTLSVDRLAGLYRIVSSDRQVSVLIRRKGLTHRPAPHLEDAMFRDTAFPHGGSYYARVGFESLSSSGLAIGPLDKSRRSYVTSTSGDTAYIHSDLVSTCGDWKVLLYRYEDIGRPGHSDLYAQVAFAKRSVGSQVVHVEQTLFYESIPPDTAIDLLLSLLPSYEPRRSRDLN